MNWQCLGVKIIGWLLLVIIQVFLDSVSIQKIVGQGVQQALQVEGLVEELVQLGQVQPPEQPVQLDS